MKPRFRCWPFLSLLSLLLFIFVLFSSCIISASSDHHDLHHHHHHHHSLSRKTFEYDAGPFQAPGRRALLSSNKQTETALVAALDGTIYLLEVGTMKPLWSFSSGPEIYSSYQAPVNDTENTSGIGSSYFIDCGDDWELYAHNSLGKLKLMKSLEEYISSTPQIAEDGGIVLGLKKTTAFLVDAKTGRVIYTYGTQESLKRQTNANDLPSNSTIKEQYQSGSDQKTNELPLYITRTDYRLTSFMPNSDKVLWNMTVAEIGAAFLCQDIEKSLNSPLLESESSEPDLPYEMPLPCQSRALVYRFRSHNLLESLSMPKGLPRAHQQDMMLPATSSDMLPSQPNVEKVSRLLPSSPINENQDQKAVVPLSIYNENREISHREDMEMLSNSDFLTVNGKLNASQLLFCITLLVFFSYGCNAFSRKKVQLVSQTAGISAPNVQSKRKRSRKSEKGGSNSGEREVEEVKITRNETSDDFWLNLSRPISCSNDGRSIGKLFVSNKEIAKGSNGTIVLEGIYEGRAVAVKRLVKAHNDIAVKEIQNLIVSDRHPNIVRWYGVEQDRDFVYLALERCTCSLNDLILMHVKSSANPILSLDEEVAEYSTRLDSVKGFNFEKDLELWTSDGCPSPLLLKLMRDVVSGIAHLHELGIIHRDLKPQNVLIISERSLCAKLSDMGISKHLVGDMSSFSNHATGGGSSGWQAPEQLLLGRQTRAVDLFSLGCVLFYCITGGWHPFGNRLERDINIAKNEVDLFLVEHIPEAVDLFMRLLDPNAEIRPKAQEVLFHPFFWSADMRLSFLRDASDRVELEDRVNDSDLLNGLESIAPLALGAKWNEKMEPAFLNNIGRYRRYKFDSVRDLLRVMRNKLNHYRELPAEIQELVGPVPDGFNRYFSSRFPKLLIEVYKVMHSLCREEEWFSKYCRGSVQ